MAKPTLFIGCSSESVKIANAVEQRLFRDAEITIYNEGFFEPGGGTLETLVNKLSNFDFAILILAPDDLVTSRDVVSHAPRDNVMFELGLFMGRLGRERTFIVHDADRNIKIPSDLAGITTVPFHGDRQDGNLESAVNPACTRIRNQIERLGTLEIRTAQQLEKATSQVEGISDTVARLVHLLAKSRVVELDIIATQFGGLIAPEQLEKIQEDLKDLEKSTDYHQYFIGTVFFDLKKALVEAASRKLPVFLVIFDENSPTKSGIDHSLKNFMRYSATQEIVRTHFVQALVSSENEGVQELIPRGNDLENCLLTILTPKGTTFLQEEVYANPEEGLVRVRNIKERWDRIHQ